MLKLLVTASMLSAITAFSTMAQTLPETVKLSLEIKQPTLLDDSKRDLFTGTIDDKTGTTTLKVECSAGASGTMGFGRVDETCAVAGNGLIKNPNKPTQTAARINYSGGFVIAAKQDGYTDATTLLAK